MKITYIKQGRGYIWRAYLLNPMTGQKQDHKSKSFPTKKEAQKDAEEMLRNYLDGRLTIISKITFDELADQWLRAKRSELSKRSSILFNELQAKALCSHFGKILIKDLSPLLVQNYYSTLKEQDHPLSSKSIEHRAKVLKSILKFAVQMKLLNNNPAEGIKSPKTHKKQLEPWTQEEFARFYAEIKKHRLFAFYRLSAYTGARRGELLALRRSDIDFVKQEITISKTRGRYAREIIETNLTKTDLPRTITLDPDTCQILRDHIKKMTLEASSSPFANSNSDAYLFIQEDGSPIDPSHPSNLFTKVSKRLGLPPQRLHDLRHFHATELIRSGANILEVSDRLGHSSIEITLGVYGHIRPEDRSQIAEKFAKVLNLV